MKRIFIIVLIFLVSSGCVENKPRPEGNVKMVPLGVTSLKERAVEVASFQQKPSLDINYHVRNQDVYVECYIPNFYFTEKRGTKINGEGHLSVYVDGEKVEEMNTAAFILKGLNKGVHQITVDVVHNDSSRYQLKKSWEVTIK